MVFWKGGQGAGKSSPDASPQTAAQAREKIREIQKGVYPSENLRQG